MGFRVITALFVLGSAICLYGQAPPGSDGLQSGQSGAPRPYLEEAGSAGDRSGWSDLGAPVVGEMNVPAAADASPSAGSVNSSDEYDFDDESARTRSMGSTYVPIDSWVYPVLERLAAGYYVSTEALSIRPWTRLQCARLLTEVHSALDQDAATSVERREIAGALDREFAPEMSLLQNGPNISAEAENAYSRVTEISGTPLRDALHFEQTLADDFGRPYGQGLNTVDGLSGRAEFGPFAFYMRGEFQHGAAIPNYSPTVQQTLATYEVLPVGAEPTFPSIDRLRPVEAYVVLNLRDWQFAFGQQSLWWGPSRSTALMMTNNAEAMPMLRLDRVSPLILPGPFKLFGPVRFTALLGRSGGAHYVRLGPTFVPYGSPYRSLNPQPFVWGSLISFKPTANLEFGLGLTVMFAGYGRPLTFRTFLHTFSFQGNAQSVDPGKRMSEFNFSYRLPFVRNWIALYAEGLAWDEQQPLVYPRRSAMCPGIYMPRLPGIPKLDLRAEGVYTNLPGLVNPSFFFTNAHYADGYTNYGQIISSWIGPQASGWSGTSTYWLSDRNTASVTYRHQIVDKSYLKGGNTTSFTGLHVYCEKMMSNTIEGARSMVQTMRETGKLLQIGHQRRSNPRYLFTLNRLLHDAQFCGRLTAVQGQWNRAVKEDFGWPKKFEMPAPMLAKYGFKDMHQFRNWRWYKGLGGGPLSDLGAHQIDIFNWWLGTTPKSVVASGGLDYFKNHDWCDNAMVIYEYQLAQGVARAFYQVQTTTSAGGGYFESFMGDDGTIKMSEDPSICAIYREARADAVSWDDLAQKGYVRAIQTPADATKVDVRETAQLAQYEIPVFFNKPPHQPHLENFFNAIRGTTKLNCPADEAFMSEYVIHKANEAVITEKKILITKEEVNA